MIVLTWSIVAALFIAPYQEPEGTIHFGEDGGSGPIDFQDELDNMSSFSSKIYRFGDANCHQKASRSYFVNGNQMPVCARDVGIFLGLAIGTILPLAFLIEIKLWWVIGSLVPMGIDGTTQLLTSYESNNPIRVLTGVLAGAVIIMLLVYMLYELEDATRTVKEERRARKAYELRQRELEQGSGPPDPSREERSGES